MQKAVPSPGLTVISLSHACAEELFVSSVPTADESSREIFKKAAKAVSERNVHIVSQEVFGIGEGEGAGKDRLQEAFGEVTWPVTWLEDGENTGLAGTFLWAVSNSPVELVPLDNRVVGTVFEQGSTRFLRLGGVVPKDTTGTPPDQARDVFDRLENLLMQAGMDFTHVVRTWFYNRDILAWYEDFNKVRDEFFRERNLYDGVCPASTGIGGSNPAGTALTAGLIAMKTESAYPAVTEVPSPMQCPALDYGSSFSRAVEAAFKDHRRLFVSGTASIEPGGATAHVGNVEAQIMLTMDVVTAILESRDMSWSDVVRGIAYVLRAEDGAVYARCCAERDVAQLPVVVANNIVCRKDLLFEIEVDAIH